MLKNTSLRKTSIRNRMSTRAKESGGTASNQDSPGTKTSAMSQETGGGEGGGSKRISPRKRPFIVGVGAVRTTNLEKAKDGSLIYRRHSSGSMSSRNSPEVTPSMRKRSADDGSTPGSHIAKRMRTIHTNSSGEAVECDAFCWQCHKEGRDACCELCPRMYHYKCLSVDSVTDDWVCPECEKILQAECVDTRSKAMALLSIDQLCVLLKYATQRMKHAESEDFHKPVDPGTVPHYTDYVFHPMDITTLEKNIRKKLYGSTEAFLADAKYILHNCVVFNGEQNKLTSSAKMIIKICKHEMSEIEICPDCYLNSCTKQQENWFCEPCRNPHTLVWAKMKGYPFWPAKALREVGNQVDVRFFGEHDRAWVAATQVFLLSQDPPTAIKKGRGGYDKSMEELELHINKLQHKFGSFEYAPNKMLYDPEALIRSAKTKLTPTKRSPKMSLGPESSPGKGRGLGGIKSPEKQASALSKTASAVKLKYNSIISTRHTKQRGRTIGDNVLCLSPSRLSQASSSPSSTPASTPQKPADVTEPPEEGVSEARVSRSQTPEEPSPKRLKITRELDLGESDNDMDNNAMSSKDPDKLMSQTDKDDHNNQVSKVTVSGDAVDEVDISISGTASDEKSRVFLMSDTTAEVTKLTSKPAGSLLNIVPKTKTICKNILSTIADKIQKLKGDDSDAADRDTPPGEQLCERTGALIRSGRTPSEGSTVEDNDCADKRETKHTESSRQRSDVAETKILDLKPIVSAADVAMEITDAEFPGSVGFPEVPETPKKNPFLEQLVASCKEKLGVDGTQTTEEQSSSSSHGAPDDSEETDDTSSSSEQDDHDDATSDEAMGKHDAVRTLTPVSGTPEKPKSAPTGGVSEHQQSKSHALTPSGENPENPESELQATPSGGDSDNNKLEMDRTSSCDEKTENSNLEVKDSGDACKQLSPDHPQKDDEKNHTETGADSSSGVQVPATDVKDGADGEGSLSSDASTVRVIKPITETNEAKQLEVEATKSKNEATPSKICSSLSKVDVTQSKVEVTQSEVVDEVDSDTDSTQMVIDLGEDADKTQATESRQSEGQDAKTTQKTSPSEGTPGGSASPRGQSPGGSASPRGQSPGGSVSLQGHSPGGSASLQAQSPGGSASPQGQSPMSITEVLPSVSVVTTTNSPFTKVSKSSPGTATVKPQGISPGVKPQTATVLPEKVAPLQKPQVTTPKAIPVSPSDKEKGHRSPQKVLEDSMPSVNMSGLDMTKYMEKISQTVHSTMGEFCEDLMKTEAGSTFRKHLQLEVKRLEWRHIQEINEIRHTANLKLLEMRAGMELEKDKMLEKMARDLRMKFEVEKKQVIDETKKKQWCSNCGKEAIFYCCWNTSYCDYPCQQSHWPEHMSSCTQSQAVQQSADTDTNQSESRTTSGQASLETWNLNPHKEQASPLVEGNRRLYQQSPVHPHTSPSAPPQYQRIPNPQMMGQGGPVVQYIQPNSSGPMYPRANSTQQFQLGNMSSLHSPLQPPVIMSMVSTGSAGHPSQLRPIMSQNIRQSMPPQPMLVPQGARLPPNILQGYRHSSY